MNSKEINEQRDDTTNAQAKSPRKSERRQFNYYDDDGTGYEIYNPNEDEEAEPSGEGTSEN